MEKILFASIPTLTELVITQADLENLGGLDPFAIEPAHIDKYKFTYLGKEKIDELDLYVFDVAEDNAQGGERRAAAFRRTHLGR